MLDKNRHKHVMLQILRDIFTDDNLASQLVFKGGTCLMLFYGLDRFSTDLDFDLREDVRDFNGTRITGIAEKYLKTDTNGHRDGSSVPSGYRDVSHLSAVQELNNTNF